MAYRAGLERAWVGLTTSRVAAARGGLPASPDPASEPFNDVITGERLRVFVLGTLKLVPGVTARRTVRCSIREHRPSTSFGTSRSCGTREHRAATRTIWMPSVHTSRGALSAGRLERRTRWRAVTSQTLQTKYDVGPTVGDSRTRLPLLASTMTPQPRRRRSPDASSRSRRFPPPAGASQFLLRAPCRRTP